LQIIAILLLEISFTSGGYYHYFEVLSIVMCRCSVIYIIDVLSLATKKSQ